jgi:hypothetical protein
MGLAWAEVDTGRTHVNCFEFWDFTQVFFIVPVVVSLC